MKKIVEFLYILLLFSPLVSFKKKYKRIPLRLRSNFIDVNRDLPIRNKELVALVRNNHTGDTFKEIVRYNGSGTWYNKNGYFTHDDQLVYTILGWMYLPEEETYKHYK